MNKSLKPFHDFQIIDLIAVWYNHKKFIFVTIVLGLISSILASILLPEYFESKTIVYPISMTMADRNIIFGQQQGQAEFSYFGNKYDASRILQVANSAEVIEHIIKKYELANHYGFDKDEKYLHTKVREEFLDNYHALKNDKDAIEITLLDKDKVKCAEMVNDIVVKIDEIATKPVTEGKTKIIRMLEKELAKKEKLLVTSRIGLSAASVTNIQSEIKQLSEALTQYHVSANDEFASITILEKAVPAEKKKKPIRWLIVLGGFFVSLFFGLIYTLVMDQFLYIRSKLIPS